MTYGIRPIQMKVSKMGLSLFKNMIFDVKYCVGIVNKDVDGLNKNPSSSDIGYY